MVHFVTKKYIWTLIFLFEMFFIVYLLSAHCQWEGPSTKTEIYFIWHTLWFMYFNYGITWEKSVLFSAGHRLLKRPYSWYHLLRLVITLDYSHSYQGLESLVVNSSICHSWLILIFQFLDKKWSLLFCNFHLYMQSPRYLLHS